MSQYSAVPSRRFTTGLAAAIAGVVTLNLVPAPPDLDIATMAAMSTTAVNTAAVRLASAVTPAGQLTTSVIQSAVTSQGTAAASPASVVVDPTTIVGFAIGLVIAPIWYLAFPFTLPFSYNLAQGPPPPQPKPTPQEVLQNTVKIFVVSPFVLGVLLATYLVPAAGTAAGAPSASKVQTSPKARIGAAAPIPQPVTPKPPPAGLMANNKSGHHK
jgi:hypothetical protein